MCSSGKHTRSARLGSSDPLDPRQVIAREFSVMFWFFFVLSGMYWSLPESSGNAWFIGDFCNKPESKNVFGKLALNQPVCCSRPVLTMLGFSVRVKLRRRTERPRNQAEDDETQVRHRRHKRDGSDYEELYKQACKPRSYVSLKSCLLTDLAV